MVATSIAAVLNSRLVSLTGPHGLEGFSWFSANSSLMYSANLRFRILSSSSSLFCLGVGNDITKSLKREKQISLGFLSRPFWLRTKKNSPLPRFH